MKRVLLWPTLILLVAGAICFWISRGEAARDDASVILCNADDIGTLDPARMSWQNDIRLAMGLWEGLVAYDPETLAPIPGAAASWEVSPDNRTYTFHLRTDGKWSNGDPVTTADFLFAWKRVLDPKNAADYANFLFYIKGAKDYYESQSGKAPRDFSTVAIHTPDTRTITLELTDPCAFFLDLVAFPVFYPLHESSMKAHLDPNPAIGYRPTWTHPPSLVTNGPFKLSEWQFKRFIKLIPNAFYWDRKAVKASAIIIKPMGDKRTALLALESRDIDVLTFVPDDSGPDLIAMRDAKKRNDVHYKPVFGTYYYAFNCTRPPFTDKRVRKAFALVVDKEKIVKEVTRMGQKPSNVLVPENSVTGYVGPKGLERNVEQAKALLAEAGFPDGKGFPEFELLYNNEAGHDKTAQAIGQMWQQNLNVRIRYKGVERNTFRKDRKAHNFDIARGGWFGDYTDPTTWLDLCNSKDNNNDAQFANPDFDALLAKAAAEPDPAKRFAILHDAEKMLIEDQFPFLPLYQYSDGYMFDPTRVGGLFLDVRQLTQYKYLYRK